MVKNLKPHNGYGGHDDYFKGVASYYEDNPDKNNCDREMELSDGFYDCLKVVTAIMMILTFVLSIYMTGV